MATNPFKLDDATKYGVIQEAEKRAAASNGKTTREQELYSYAQSEGIDDAGLDTYMGFDAGTSANFAKGESVRNLAAQALAQRDSAPAATSPQTAALGATSASTGIIGGAASGAAPAPLDQATKAKVMAEAARRAQANGTTAQQELYRYAQSEGIGDAGIDAYMGLNPGETANWAKTGNVNANPGKYDLAPYSVADKGWMIAEANKRAIANGTSVAAEIAKAATDGGMSLADAEIKMGYAPGTLTGGAGGAGGGAAGGGGAAPGGTPPAGTNALGGAVVPGVTPGAKLTDPSTWTTTSDQTVAGQLPGIMDPNNPLMQRARTNARVSANSRGLLNSTIAESGADAAMNDIALQIAQADAAQGSKVANFNASAQNQFAMADKAQGFDLAKMDRAAAITLGQMSAEQQNVIARLAVQQGYNLDTIKANQVNDLAKIAVQLDGQGRLAEQKYGFDKNLVEIQKASNLEIAGIDAQYRQQIQGSASATSIMNQLPLLIAKVMDNKDTTAEAKQAQINYYIATSTAALKLAGQFAGDVDLSGSLDGILSITP